jgi:phosphoglycerol transferase MdoB-like AlkP superfamily enzyme
MLGGIAGLLRWGQWTRPLPRAALVLPVFALLLLLGLPFAALYSGPGIAVASLARVILFAISIYIFLYVAGGPGEHSPARTLNAMRWVYAAAVASASFACIDFYFQFPAPAGFGPQFIWLDSGIYRRAQGLFYEASTLGNVCSFFLVFAVVSWSYSAKLQGFISRFDNSQRR